MVNLRKSFGTVILLLLILVISACSQDPTIEMIKDVTGASTKQAEAIESFLEVHEIEFEEIVTSNNSLLDTLNDMYELYDLIDHDGDVKLLLLQDHDKSVSAVLDTDYTLIWGMIDNGMGLPDYEESLIRE